MSSSSNTGRYCFTCFYRGQSFYGWQSQPDVPTVQDALEETWSECLGVEVSVQGSGRTDRGVNALGQVAHVDIHESVSIPFSRWESLLNHRLSRDLGISNLQPINNQFHARHSAIRRYYGYRFLLTDRNPLSRVFDPGAWVIASRNWNSERVRWLSSQYNRGVPTDLFSGRGGSKHQADRWSIRSRIRFRKPDEVWLLISSKSFRYQMVRCLAGALQKFSAGQWSKQQIMRRFQQNKGSFQPAPPRGCYLLGVDYPDDKPFQYRHESGGWNRVLECFS